MIYTFLLAFLISFAFCFLWVRFSSNAVVSRFALPDRSTGVSRMGGPILLVVFFLGVGSSLRLPVYIGFLFYLSPIFLFAFLLGLIDDIRDLSASKKLVAEFAIALFLFLVGVRVQIAFLPFWANLLLTLLWFPAIMNALNLLDILDGLAASICVICGATFLFLSFLTQNALVGVLAAVLLGANLGFLKFNLRPARLYLGDSGSLLNGLILAVAAILLSYASAGREIALFVPLLVLLLPLSDLFFVVVMRLREGKPVTKKSKDHFVLRLMAEGEEPTTALLWMVVLNLFFNAAALGLFMMSHFFGKIILLVSVLFWLVLAFKVARVKIHED